MHFSRYTANSSLLTLMFMLHPPLRDPSFDFRSTQEGESLIITSYLYRYIWFFSQFVLLRFLVLPSE